MCSSKDGNRSPPGLRRIAAARVVFTLVLIAAALPCAVRPSFARGELHDEAVKVSYLYNFMRFGDWPAGELPADRESLTLCVIGRDPFRRALAAIRGAPAQERRVHTRVDVSVAEIGACQLVFVPEGEAAQLAAITRGPTMGCLIVTDDENGLAGGAAIVLRRYGEKLGFAVNLTAARRAGIRLPASLLRLAVEVRE